MFLRMFSKFFNKFLVKALILLNLFLGACTNYPKTESYQELYQHLKKTNHFQNEMVRSDFFIIFLVDARHLDYTDNYSFFNTLTKHPDDCSKNGDVGHAWIYLEGWCQGERICLEGGHSGERGILQAKYFDGIMNYNECGYANPKNKNRVRYEPNPIKYLWTAQKDGFFEVGGGIHSPTYAAKIDLTEQQFSRILDFIYNRYPFEKYALTGYQCSSFVEQLAKIAGLRLNSEICVRLLPQIHFRGRTIRFWEDSSYSEISFSSPDILEKSLMEAVRRREAEYALTWYLSHSPYAK